MHNMLNAAVFVTVTGTRAGFAGVEHRQMMKDALGVMASRLNTAATSQTPCEDLLQ